VRIRFWDLHISTRGFLLLRQRHEIVCVAVGAQPGGLLFAIKSGHRDRVAACNTRGASPSPFRCSRHRLNETRSHPFSWLAPPVDLGRQRRGVELRFVAPERIQNAAEPTRQGDHGDPSTASRGQVFGPRA